MGGPGAVNLDTDWESHWRQYARATDLNPGQHHRRRLIHRLLRDAGAGSGSTILDAGSGAGDLLRVMSGWFPGASLTGVEPSAEGVEVARALVPGVRMINAGLYPLTDDVAALEGWASHAVCSEVLEHVDDPIALLRNVASCMRDESTLIVTVPGGPRTAFDRAIGHLRHYTRESAEQMVRDAGLVPVRAMASGFPFFNLYRLAVLLRGDKVAEDAVGMPGLPARMVLAVFRWLMPLNFSTIGPGWQIVVVARKPAA